MPRYLYTGPDDQRGHVPSWGFDDGVLAPDHLVALIARGHVRDLSENPIVVDEPEAEDAAEPEAAPVAKPRKARR